MTLAASDPRSVPKLFEVALGGGDEDQRWGAIAALHWRGCRDSFGRAAELCRSEEARERALGADVLGQLGIPERTFPDEGFALLLELLSDKDAEVLYSAIVALHHVDAEQAVAHVLRFKDHPHENVRFAVAFALGGADGDEAIDALVALARDVDGEVRNWATFGLGQQSDADTLKIRDALAAGLEDSDEDVRYEAVIGLARRRDARMIGFLKTMLHDDPADMFAREAAARLLGMTCDGDTETSELLGALQRRQRWFRGRFSPLKRV